MTWALRVTMAVLLSSTAWSAPRVSVHPLAVDEFAPHDRKKLQATFEVMLARLPGVQLAGTSRVEEALAKEAGRGCEERDSCLRFLAEATDSLYGVFASIRADALGAEMIASARVVRSDGAVVRRTLAAKASTRDKSIADAGREALGRLLTELRLEELPDTIPVGEVPGPAVVVPSGPLVAPAPSPAAPIAAPPVVAARGGTQRVIGWSVTGLGVAGVLGGGVLAGLAASRRGSLGADAAGVVPPENAAAASSVVQQSRTASVVLAAGGTVAVLGALVLLWPTSGGEAGASLGASVTGEGASVVVVGRFP